MESSLHRQLKHHYAGGPGGRVEVALGVDRVDAIDPEGRAVEVQCGPTSSLRPKLGRLLASRRVRVVVPVVASRRIIRPARPGEPEPSGRLSPKRGRPFDSFEHLVGLASLLPLPGLEVVVALVDIDELRLPTRKGRGFRVLDRRLRRIDSETSIGEPADLRALLPDDLPDPFSTRELADRSGRPDWVARRAAYCLRVAGAAVEGDRLGRCRGYHLSNAVEA